MGFTILVLAIYVLAVMRVTRLFTDDFLLDPWRVALARRYGPNSGPVYFLNCPWCVGFWISVILAAGVIPLLNWQWWALLPVALACSQLVGMFAPLYRDDEIDFETVDVE